MKIIKNKNEIRQKLNTNEIIKLTVNNLQVLDRTIMSRLPHAWKRKEIWKSVLLYSNDYEPLTTCVEAEGNLKIRTSIVSNQIDAIAPILHEHRSHEHWRKPHIMGQMISRALHNIPTVTASFARMHRLVLFLFPPLQMCTIGEMFACVSYNVLTISAQVYMLYANVSVTLSTAPLGVHNRW